MEGLFTPARAQVRCLLYAVCLTIQILNMNCYSQYRLEIHKPYVFLEEKIGKTSWSCRFVEGKERGDHVYGLFEEGGEDYRSEGA